MDFITRYVSSKVVVSGNRVEVWKYEKPIRADVVDRFSGFAKDIVTDEVSGSIKLDSNLRRARFSIRQLVWSNLTEYTKFITLTFKETVLDIQVVNKCMQEFFRRLKRNMKIQPAYIWVPEHQLKRGDREGNKGCLHVHVVLFNVEKIPIEILNKCWPYGRTDIRILNGLRLSDEERIRSAAAYLSKYISKESLVEFGKHTYRASLNLKRPVFTGVYCYKNIKKDGSIEFFYDDSSFDVKNIYVEFHKSYLFNYEINGEPVQNCCLYMQGELKNGFE